MSTVLQILLVVVILAGLTVLGLVLFTLRATRRVEAALPPCGKFVDLPGARLHVVDRGQGPTVLLVHGLAGQLSNFTYGMVDLLATQFRVVAVDRPGSGYSVRASGASATLGAQADVLAALIDKLQLGRTLVVGHSLGGAVALSLAQRHPRLVAGLALVAPLTHEPEGVPPAFSGMAITQSWLRRFVAWTLALPATLILRDRMLAMIFGPDPVPADFAERGGGLLAARPSHFIGASADLAAVREDMPGMEQRYAGMQLPVNILFGRDDRILDPKANGEALAARLPGAQLTIVPGGHMLPVTAPALTAQFVRGAASRAFAPPS